MKCITMQTQCKKITFQTQINLHKQYIFDTANIKREYAFLFPFSILNSLYEITWQTFSQISIADGGRTNVSNQF